MSNLKFTEEDLVLINYCLKKYYSGLDEETKSITSVKNIIERIDEEWDSKAEFKIATQC